MPRGNISSHFQTYPPNCMYCHRKGLCQDRLTIGNFIAQRMTAFRLHRDEFREATVPAKPDVSSRGTQRRLALSAVVAFSAPIHCVYRNPIAHVYFSGLPPLIHDLTGELVPKHNRNLPSGAHMWSRGHEDWAVFDFVEISVAHARILNLDDNFIRCRRGFRKVLVAKIFSSVIDNGFHFPSFGLTDSPRSQAARDLSAVFSSTLSICTLAAAQKFLFDFHPEPGPGRDPEDGLSAERQWL